MTPAPVVCTPDESCLVAAQRMRDRDCGCVPVVRGARDRRLVGILTDRDVCCRVDAQDRRASATRVGEVMTPNVVTCFASDSVEEVVRLMEECQVRRIPIVDAKARCIGIISQADLTRSRETLDRLAEVVHVVSQPSPDGAAGPESLVT